MPKEELETAILSLPVAQRANLALKLIASIDDIPKEIMAKHRPPRKPSGNSVEETLRKLAEAGEVTRARRSKGDWQWKVEGLGIKPRTSSALLDELREDHGLK